MQIAGVRSEAITANPKIDVRRLNFRDLAKLAGRPVFFNSTNDELFSLDRFRFLMLDRRPVTITELCECKFALRGIDLLSLLL